MNRIKPKLRKLPAQSLRLAATFAILLSLVWGVAQAQSTSSAPQNMLGQWQGFFQSYPPDPITPVRFEVTAQDNRRINGLMEVGGVEPTPFALMFSGTVAASDRVNLQGRHEERHGVAKLDLHDFGGGAAVLNGSLALLSPGGQVSDGSLLLLRSFTLVACGSVPNPAGSYRGAFHNADGTTGEISALPIPDDGQPTSFTGQVVVVAFGVRHTFELKGTINCDGRLIAIGQAAAGHLIFDATWVPVPNDGMPPMITGRHILELNDGTVHEGTFSMTTEPAR